MTHRHYYTRVVKELRQEGRVELVDMRCVHVAQRMVSVCKLLHVAQNWVGFIVGQLERAHLDLFNDVFPVVRDQFQVAR